MTTARKLTPGNMARLVSVACMATCVADLVVLYITGSVYPGYSQVKNTISSLGASQSPVSNLVSAWWILIGIVFIFFGLVFGQVFRERKKMADLAAWLIMIYGIGEGIGSGAFKANHEHNMITVSYMLHNTLGGIGVTAVLLLPLFVNRVIRKNENRRLYRLSVVVFVLNMIFNLFFAARFLGPAGVSLSQYEGLWQRIFLVTTYVYFFALSLLVYKKAGLSINAPENL